MKTSPARLAVLLGLVLPPFSASAPAAEWRGIEISGFADLYGTAVRGEGGGRNFGGLGTAATREGELALDLAGLELRREPAPWGFTLLLATGDELEAMHAAEKPWARDDFRYVYQASVSWRREALRLEAGLFPSHIGYESALPHSNGNLTHSWVATLSPFYQTGVKAIYKPGDATTVELHLLNGWQQIADLNGGKSWGLKLARRFGPLAATLNGIRGDEPTLGGDLPRQLWDLILELQLPRGFGAALETYRGRQRRGAGPDGDWHATAVWLRWQEGKNSLTLRAERFGDDAGAMSGTPQTLESATATWDLQVHRNARLRLELRRDDSTALFFADGKERRQDLAVVGLALTVDSLQPQAAPSR